MDKRKFNFWNRISAAFVLVVSAVTYLLTIEPTASFWDCGEFIASSYKQWHSLPLRHACYP